MRYLLARTTRCALTVFVLLTVAGAVAAESRTVDFEDLPLEGSAYYNGADLAGGFSSRGVGFNNQYADYGYGCCWNGWAYSRATDRSTPGPANQYSAWPGRGAAGSTTYGVAFSGHDAGGGLIPQITLPPGAEPVQISIANTTYAALSMQNGDGFARQFGGPTGDLPDWLLLSIEGRDADDELLATTSIYLADYRPADANDDMILDTWTEVDLTPLAALGVTTLAFRLASTDNGQFGMNTPAYFAADNLILQFAASPGDLDGDGKVDRADLTYWQQTFGEASGEDLMAWQRAWSPTTPTSQVPTPTSLALIATWLAIRTAQRKQSRETEA